MSLLFSKTVLKRTFWLCLFVITGLNVADCWSMPSCVSEIGVDISGNRAVGQPGNPASPLGIKTIFDHKDVSSFGFAGKKTNDISGEESGRTGQLNPASPLRIKTIFDHGDVNFIGLGVFRQSGSPAVRQSGSLASPLRIKAAFDRGDVNLIGLEVFRQSGKLAVGQTGNPVLSLFSGFDEDYKMVMAAVSEHDDHGVPGVVFYQLINFLLFVSLLFYLLKDKVRAFYQGRYDLFQQQFEASKKEREAMEASYKDYQEKLEHITTTESQQIDKAKLEAKDMKARMLEDAGLEVQRIQREAQSLLDLEDKKAQRQMQVEFSQKIIAKIQSEISKNITNEDKKALIQQFIKQVPL